jgi:hypothetical protein
VRRAVAVRREPGRGAPVTHDPICPLSGECEDDDGHTFAGSWVCIDCESACQCGNLRAARKQAIDDCIKVVEGMPYWYMRREDDGMASTHGAIKANTVSPLLEASAVLDALRALRDQT